MPIHRSVSSSSYSDSGIGTSSRYLTPSSSSSSLSRDRNGISSGTSVVDRLTNKYSSSIHSRCTSPWRSGSSTYLDLLGGDDCNSDLRRDQHQESSSSSASSVSSSSSVNSSRYSTLHKRRPPLSTVLTSHARNDSVAAPAEVTVSDQRNNNNNDDDHDADVDRPSYCNNNNDNPQRCDHEDSLSTESGQPPNSVAPGDRSGGGLIGANLNPLTNFPTNLDNTELLTNNNARYREGKIIIEVQGGDSIRIIDQVIRDDSESINRLEDFKSKAKTGDDPFEDPFFTTNNTFASGILENGVRERPPVEIHGDDPSLMPSTSRRADQFSTSINSTNDATSLPSSSTAGVSGTRQNNFRGGNEKIVSDYISILLKGFRSSTEF